MILGGMKEGREKAMNISKTSEVLQTGWDKSPSQFYECLCEAFHLYTPLTWKPLKTSG
jgi:hypothetical protein